MELERFAPAKVNLFLHVGALAPDGYHPISSLVTFADVGDVVRLRRGGEAGFLVEGAFAEGLSAEADNLVTRARDRYLAARPGLATNFQLTLDKRLPIAAGLGGGSSDAAAALLVLDEALGGNDEGVLEAIATSLGSDVPMCLKATPSLAEGRGELLKPPPAFPDLEAVLVNPRVASPTGKVYGAYDAAGAPGGAKTPAWPAAMTTAKAVADFLTLCRNDLEAPAVRLQPAIGEALAVLHARPETLFARMSGSGATCFALCADRPARDALALGLAALKPDWWVQPCRLAGSTAG